MIEQKAQNYAMSFFFSMTPDDWDYDTLTNFLRKQEGDFLELDELNIYDLIPWEPFEAYNPSWVANQMDMMVFQLVELFS